MDNLSEQSASDREIRELVGVRTEDFKNHVAEMIGLDYDVGYKVETFNTKEELDDSADKDSEEKFRVSTYRVDINGLPMAQRSFYRDGIDSSNRSPVHVYTIWRYEIEPEGIKPYSVELTQITDPDLYGVANTLRLKNGEIITATFEGDENKIPLSEEVIKYLKEKFNLNFTS